MRTIIILSDNPKLRGRAFSIAKELKDDMYRVYYVMWDDPLHMPRKELFRHVLTSTFPKDYIYEGVMVHKIGRLPGYWPYVNGLFFKNQIRKLYKKLHADIIYTATYTNETEIPKGLPFIYDLADDYSAPAELYGSHLYKLAFRLLDVSGTMKRQCKNALAVTAVSDILVDFAKRYNGVVLKLANGVNAEMVNKVIRENRSRNARPHSMVYVSGFHQWSRVIETMQAVVELKNEFPDIDLTLIGPGVESQNIKKFIKDHKAAHFLHYMGPILDRQKVLEHIARSSIGLNISVKDKFRDAAYPVKVIEYSSMGKKVVSTDLAEVNKLNFSNVFIFSDSKQGPDLKSAMRNSLLHQQTKHESDYISEKVLKNYSWHRITGSLLALINDVVNT
jgi:glycosyltransferase involved in cell wall biosynthesis